MGGKNAINEMVCEETDASIDDPKIYADTPRSDCNRFPARGLYLMVEDGMTGTWRFPRMPYVPYDNPKTKPKSYEEVTARLQQDHLGSYIHHNQAWKDAHYGQDSELTRYLSRQGMELFGEDAELYMPTNRPMAHWKEVWEGRTAEPKGARHFFWRVQWLGGTLKRSDNITGGGEAAWLTKEEVQEVLPKDLADLLEPILLR